MKNTITKRYLSRCSLVTLLAAGVGGGTALSAQQADKPGFGVSVSLVSLAGDDADQVSMGFGIGAFWQTPFTKNLSGRIGVDYVSYGAKDANYVEDGFNVKTNTKMNQLGASYDLLYDLSENFYVLGGVGYYKTEFTVSVTAELSGISATVSDTESENKVGFGLGAGFRFGRSFGLEAKYIAIGDFPRTQLSASWRF